jgi:hypothetical protein
MRGDKASKLLITLSVFKFLIDKKIFVEDSLFVNIYYGKSTRYYAFHVFPGKQIYS